MFQNHAEKEFWERVVVSIIGHGYATTTATTHADLAVTARRERMVELLKKPPTKESGLS